MLQYLNNFSSLINFLQTQSRNASARLIIYLKVLLICVSESVVPPLPSYPRFALGFAAGDGIHGLHLLQHALLK